MKKSKFVPPNDPILPTLTRAVNTRGIHPFIQEAVQELKKDQGIMINNINLDYFHYKPGSSCRIVYRLLHPDARETIACGKVLPKTRKNKAFKGDKSYYIPYCHMKLYVLPNDNKLPGLKNIMNPRWLASFPDLFYPGQKSSENRLKRKNIRLSIISYRPGNRCLIRVDGRIKGPKEKNKFTSYVKVYPVPVDEFYVKTLMDLGKKTQGSYPIFPKITGISKENGAVFFEAVKGEFLFSSLKPESEKKIARRLSLALKEIHEIPLKMPAAIDPVRELREFEDCVASLGRISDKLYLPAKQLYENLVYAYFLMPNLKTVTVHGDFSHEQILVRKKYVFVLDFDRLSKGDRYSDLGNFIADNIDAVLSSRVSRFQAKKFTQRFIREYFLMVGEPLDTYKIRWFTASGLLKLAIRPLRRAEPDWLQRSRSIIKNGLKVLDGAWDDFFLPISISVNTKIPVESNIVLKELENSERLHVQGKAEPQNSFKLKKAWPSKSSWILLYEKKKAKKGREFQYIKISDTKKSMRRSVLDERTLAHLPYCLDQANMEEILRSKAPEFWNLSSEMRIENIWIKSYKPEHRCLIEYRLRKKSASKNYLRLYGKICRTLKEAEFLYQTSKFFFSVLYESRPELFSFIPEPLLIHELNAVFFSHIPGKEFHLLLIEKDNRNALEKIGLGLKTFHEGKFRCEKQHLWKDEMMVLERWIKPVKGIFPIVSQDLVSFLNYLKDRGRIIKAENLVPVHRDFYDKQILVDRNTIAFLDFDNVSMGDPAVDIGNFIAHLYLRTVQMGEDKACFNQLSSVFLKAYAPPSEKEFLSRISLYTGTSLLRLACVYLVRPGGRLLYYPLLREIKQLPHLFFF